jgi:hypothetical protein
LCICLAHGHKQSDFSRIIYGHALLTKIVEKITLTTVKHRILMDIPFDEERHSIFEVSGFEQCSNRESEKTNIISVQPVERYSDDNRYKSYGHSWEDDDIFQ